MRLEEVEELHYIIPIANLPSIMRLGILSHNLAQKHNHISVADPNIQDRRVGKRIPGGRFLHDYVNLYFCARNPMLYKLKDGHSDLCVLRVGQEILNLPGVIIADCNASSNWAGFYSSPEGLAYLDGELIFAEYWTHPGDQGLEWRRKSIKCAEVLVPNRVQPVHILGAYVSCREAMIKIHSAVITLTLEEDAHMFFG